MKKFLWLLTILALVMFAAADGAVFKSGKSVAVADNYSSGGFYSASGGFASGLISGGGYVAEFDKSFDIESFAKSLGAKKVAEFKNGTNTEIYYYSDEIAGCVIVGGKRVNLHCVKEETRVVAGAPFIYAGY